MLPDNINPAFVADQAIQAEITRLQKTGELAVQGWTENARPAAGWDLDSFRDLLRTRTAVTPEFPGAQVGMGWLGQAKDAIGGAEGREDYAYHGIYSPMRKDGLRVKDGHGSQDEVSIGYGFNLQRRDAREVFQLELGIDSKGFDDVFNGRRPITLPQQERLREFAILEANAGVSRAIGGRPLRDHQRAALASLAYNAGVAGVRPLTDAIREGKSDSDIARMILSFKTMPGGKLANRRKHEAALWLGAQSQDFFAGVNANQLPALAPEAQASRTPAVSP